MGHLVLGHNGDLEFPKSSFPSFPFETRKLRQVKLSERRGRGWSSPGQAAIHEDDGGPF